MGKKTSKSDSMGAMPSPVSDDSWKHEDDARTLGNAAEILGDPKRVKNAAKFHKKKKKAMRSVDDLIKHRNVAFGKEEMVPGDNDADDGATG